ncbi:ester cyclase [Haloarchaeobius sp. HRN-SO-5]|uniref:ester cyclase n=1 Tax=Haloarchaeobius sp. HRN-SO-5 TaxID=3446118 RepID=UPI003EBA7FE3
MTIEENKEIALRSVEEMWNEQNLDAIDELYSQDYVGHWFRVGGGDADRDALEAFVREVHEGFPDYHMDVEFVLAEDDLVTVGFTGAGTHEGTYMGIEPSGKPATGRPIPGHITSRIEDGQIVEGWATWDALSLLQELDVVPDDLTRMQLAADD